jgi:LysM repeat protein
VKRRDSGKDRQFEYSQCRKKREVFLKSRFSLFSFVLLFLLSGCAMRAENEHYIAKQESAFQSVRADLEELKHRLHNFEVDLRIVTERLVDQDGNSHQRQEEVVQETMMRHQEVSKRVATLERKQGILAKSGEAAVGDIQNLRTHANRSTESLQQFERAVGQVGQRVKKLELQLNKEVAGLKAAAETLLRAVENPQEFQANSWSKRGNSYKVISGDTLERIASRHDTSVEAIKLRNHLSSDLIVIGQELELP